MGDLHESRLAGEPSIARGHVGGVQLFSSYLDWRITNGESLMTGTIWLDASDIADRRLYKFP